MQLDKRSRRKPKCLTQDIVKDNHKIERRKRKEGLTGEVKASYGATAASLGAVGEPDEEAIPLSSYPRNGNSFSWLFIEIGHVTRSIYLSHALCPRRIGFMEARTETLRDHPPLSGGGSTADSDMQRSSAERDVSSPLDPDPWAEISFVNPTLDYPGDPVQGIRYGKRVDQACARFSKQTTRSQ